MIFTTIRSISLCAAVAIVSATTSKVNAGSPVIYEPFDMVTGTLDGQEPSGFGLSGKWKRVQGSPTIDLLVSSGNLSYGSLPAVGNSVDWTGRDLDRTYAISPGKTLADAGLLKNGAELWFSIVHAPTTSSNASLVFALGDEAVADPHRIENNGNGIGFRIQNGSDLNAVTFKKGEFVRNVAKKGLAEDEPHLIVGKIEWGSTNGDEDTLTLFLPDRRLKLRSALPKPIGATLDQSSFDTISLFGRNYGMVDEIRFGGSFDDVVSELASSKPASAAAEPAPVEAKATLGQVASAKRSAVFQLSTRTDHSFGVFISKEGHGLVHLQALAKGEKPRVELADGSSPEIDSILAVFPEQELALLKMSYAPESWLEIAAAEPKINERIALVTLNTDNPWDGSVPLVEGPVMAKRSNVTANLREARFVRVLSIGSGLSGAQMAALGPGRFAVNSNGELIAFSSGTRGIPPQTFIYVAPVTHLVDQIAAVKEKGRGIGFPLPENQNPIDVASLDDDFHEMNLAEQQDNWAEYQRLVLGLSKRYPKSALIRGRLGTLCRPDMSTRLPKKFDAAAFMKNLKVNPDDPAAVQVACMEIELTFLIGKERFAEAIKLAKQAIKLAPADYPDLQIMVATALATTGKLAEAEVLARKVYRSNSDSLDVVHMLGFILVSQGKSDKDPDLRGRIRELETIYGMR